MTCPRPLAPCGWRPDGEAAALPFAWQLRVELLDVTPTIWRRLLVPPTPTLPKLHHALQIALGWTDSHLHEFVINGMRHGMPDPDWQDEWPVMDERRVPLHEALVPGVRCFEYVYDFGDDWHHAVVIESLYAPLAPRRAAVYCTDGDNACPPEDVGGAPGYAEFLAALGPSRTGSCRDPPPNPSAGRSSPCRPRNTRKKRLPGRRGRE